MGGQLFIVCRQIQLLQIIIIMVTWKKKLCLYIYVDVKVYVKFELSLLPTFK